jgi:cytochrome c-type biogenesis protein CcmH/NrfG
MDPRQNPKTPPSRPADWLPSVLAAAIFLLAFAPFIPAINAGFCNFDDPAIFNDVDGYKGLAPKNLAWMFTTTHMGHYQPLTWLSYAINYDIGGKNAGGYHITSMLLHAATAVLVYLVARRLLRDALGWLGDFPVHLELAAAGAAVLFAVHPLRVESVAWLTERRDVLSGFFLLAALLAYLRAFPARSVAPATGSWYLGSILLLLLSLLSKAWGMSFFVIVLVLDWFPLGRLPASPAAWFRGPARTVLLQKLPYAVMGVAAAVMAGYATASVPYTVIAWSDWGLGARAVQAVYGLMFYIQKTLWPTRLASMYELPRGLDPTEPRFLAPWAFVVAAGLVVVLLRRRVPGLLAAALIYVVILAPVLGLRQAGPQLVADRYTYLANIPWAVLTAAGAVWWVRRTGGRGAAPLGVAAVAVALVLGVLTWRQTSLWRDTAALYRHNIESGADGPLARIFYGRELAQGGRKEEALVQFEKATELSPSFGEGWFACGALYREFGRVADAERAYQIAQKLMPDSWRASMMLGILYMTKLDRPADAEAQFRAAVANVESPGIQWFSPRPYLMLAAALDINGDERGAREMLQKAAKYDETRAEALERLKEMDEGSGG